MQSAKTNLNVEEVFFSIARDIKQRLAETESKVEVWLCSKLLYTTSGRFMNTNGFSLHV